MSSAQDDEESPLHYHSDVERSEGEESGHSGIKHFGGSSFVLLRACPKRCSTGTLACGFQRSAALQGGRCRAEARRYLLREFLVFRFRLFQDRDVWISIFPQVKEVLIGGASFGESLRL